MYMYLHGDLPASHSIVNADYERQDLSIDLSHNAMVTIQCS